MIHEERSATPCQIRSYDEKQGIGEEVSRRGIGNLPKRLGRYSAGRVRSQQQASYLQEVLPGTEGPERRELGKIADELQRCGEYLGFRHYFTIDELRLHSGYFCQRDKLCGICQIRRASKLLRAYSEKVAEVLRQRPSLRGCMATLTVKDGPDLVERLRHLLNAHSKLLENRKRRLQSERRPWTEAVRADGGVSRVEVKRGANSGEWHPHIHSAWLCQELPDEAALSREWFDITGDSWQVKVSPFQAMQAGSEITAEAVAADLVEVLKYAVKLSEMTPADAWHVHDQTRGKKLVRPFGCLHGVEVPEGCLDDPLKDTDLPFVELIFRHSAEGYVRC